MTSEATEDLWLFGYGSLIWKPPPHFGKHLNRLVILGISIDQYQTCEYPATLKATCGAFGRQGEQIDFSRISPVTGEQQ